MLGTVTSVTCAELLLASDIAPIDMILGNHDCVINQHDREDSLSPVVRMLKKQNKPINLFLEAPIKMGNPYFYPDPFLHIILR